MTRLGRLTCVPMITDTRICVNPLGKWRANTISCARLTAGLALFTVLGWSECSPTALCIDDFASGEWSAPASPTGSWDTKIQNGTMLGGWRTVSIITTVNPYGLPVTANIIANSGRLALGSGPHTTVRLDLDYGLRPGPDGKPIQNEVSFNAEAYDRLRIKVGYNDLRLNVLALVYSDSGVSSVSANIDPSSLDQSKDLLFSAFKPLPNAKGADFSNIKRIWLVFQPFNDVLGSSDYVIKALEFRYGA